MPRLEKSTDPKVIVHTRLPLSVDSALRDFANEHGVSYAAAMEHLLTDALKRQAGGEGGTG